MPEEYLKDLINLSKAIYENAEEIYLDPSDTWDEDMFLKDWFMGSDNKDKYITQSPGWYWIGCDISFSELMDLNCPQGLPTKACELGKLSKENYKTFGEDYLCKVDDKSYNIIYNGHENRIIPRLRIHFTLKNNHTGALGLRHYDLSRKNWKIRFFGKPHIDRLKDNIQEEVYSMIEEKPGRIAIENAWRAKYGWPILCKA